MLCGFYNQLLILILDDLMIGMMIGNLDDDWVDVDHDHDDNKDDDVSLCEYCIHNDIE